MVSTREIGTQSQCMLLIDPDDEEEHDRKYNVKLEEEQGDINIMKCNAPIHKFRLLDIVQIVWLQCLNKI